MAKKKLIDLYPYRLTENKAEYLLLKRARGQKYDGQWRMIGGKVEEGETYWKAALRELAEETGLKPIEFWSIPSLNKFYEHQTDSILLIPAFAAQIDSTDAVILNKEHSVAKWFDIDRAVECIPWPEQRRLLKLLDSIITSNQILDDWLVSLH
ncbi:MAG: NUDIX domain-containing protein [Balneolaceae bacterium]|nr:NUDIX domain-containing protein [Balneolaceae bacterium]